MGTKNKAKMPNSKMELLQHKLVDSSVQNMLPYPNNFRHW